MPAEKTCPTCGKSMTDDALMGLCPDCLLQAGFGTMDTGPEASGKPLPFVPPTPEELARYFPELEIIELLGRGGMGAVYKARQKRLERLVALKILPPGVGQDPSFADRFEREAKALAQLHHPNIVTLYDSGQVDGLFYFFMEFVDGVNLRQLLDTGHVSPKEALAIVPQICDALQFAHDRGIIHRDIKPENILLNKEGHVKIADFGVAKIVARELPDKTTGDAVAPEFGQTEAGKVIGTPQYMAPEQLSHPLDVDNRADIYALGVVFYQMLTGELPAGKFGPPSSKVQIDVRLDDIVLRALQKQPELRYQQASALKTQVETIASTRSEQVQLDSKQSRADKEYKPWLSQYRWILILTALILIPFVYVLVRNATWIKNDFVALVTPLDGAYKPNGDSEWTLYLKKDGNAYYYDYRSRELYYMRYKVTGEDISLTFPDGWTDILYREGDTLVGNKNNKLLGDETTQYHRDSEIPFLSSQMKPSAEQSSPAENHRDASKRAADDAANTASTTTSSSVAPTKDLVGVGRLYHALVYRQTSSTSPQLSPNSYQFIADIPNNTFPISGGTVSLPPKATWPTNPVTVVDSANLVGAHFLYVQGFDSKAALWSNFPDGNYVYNIQPKQSGDQTSSYAVQVPFTGSVGFPPIAPVVTNETWKSGALVLQPTSAIINFTNYPGATLTWEIVAPGMSAGGGGTSLGSLNLTGLLGYGRTYQAQLRFINHDSSKTVSNPNEPKNYNYETMMATIVEFTITTPQAGNDAASPQGSPAADASSPASIIQTIANNLLPSKGGPAVDASSPESIIKAIANNVLASQGIPAAGTSGPVSITKAYYEAKDGAGAKDVTGIITKMVKNNRLDVSVGNDVFGGDPAWLHVKQLRVDYTIDGKKHEATADEGTTLSIPDQTNVPNLAPTPDPQVTSGGKSHDDKEPGDKKYDDLFALPPIGSLGQRGRAMEIHATFSRQLEPGVAAVHYFNQYRGVDAGISFGDEIAVYGLPSSFEKWKGDVYPAGYMTFGNDRLFVYATSKEQAMALLEKENEKDRKFAP